MSGEAEECTRLGRAQFRVCVFHSRHGAAFSTVGEILKSMYRDVLSFGVDLVAGDGNKHTQYHSEGHKRKCKAQDFMELQNSLINLCARAFFSHYNEGLPFAARADVQFFDSNSFMASNSAEAETDCMLVQVISLGKSPGSSAGRQNLRETLVRIMKASWFPTREGPPGDWNEALVWADQHSVTSSGISTSTRSTFPQRTCHG